MSTCITKINQTILHDKTWSPKEQTHTGFLGQIYVEEEFDCLA